jgi:hypothetical protein
MRHTNSAITTAMSGLLLSGACGVRHLDPMPAPPQELPHVTSDPPPVEPGTTPVAIDSVDTPARVYDELGQDICVTPCITNLTPGVHDLLFKPIDHFSDRIGAPPITVGQRPMVYRYQLGRYTHHDGLRAAGLTFVSLGGIAATTALPLLLMDNTHEAGVDVGLGAASLLVVGVVMAIAGRDVAQMGSGTQWSPPSTAIYAVPR